MITRRRLPDLAIALLGLAGLLALAGTLWGARAVPVLTGSMAPGLPRGSLVLTTPVGVDQVRPGMVLAFRPPPPYDTGRAVMHRVRAATPGGPGAPLVVTTRGDANPTDDPWRLALTPGAQLGQQRLAAPLLGHVLAGGRHSAVPLAAGALLLAVAGALRRRPLHCACAPA